MNKRKSIIKLSFIVGALIIALVLAFLQVGKINRYMGFAGTIDNNMGAASQGGAVVVYSAKETETRSKAKYSEQLNAVMYLMRVNLSTTSDTNTSSLITKANDVIRQGSNKIRIETQTGSAAQITALAETQIKVVFTDANGEKIADGNIIQNARFTTRLQSYVIEIEITDAGKVDLEEASAGTISIIDQTAKDAAKEESVYKIADVPADTFKEGVMSGNKIIISAASTSSTDINALNVQYMKILAGSRPLRISLVSAETVVEARAQNQALLSLIAGISLTVLLIAFFAIRYRLMGLSAIISMLSYMVFMLFFAAVLPFAKLSFLGLSVITLITLLNAGSYVYTFENIKEEYRKGKSIQASVASGFKKSFWPLLDIHIFAALAGIGLWILGEGAALSAGMIIFFASILSALSAAGLMRYLIRLTTNIYGDDLQPRWFALKRPAHIKESDAASEEENLKEERA